MQMCIGESVLSKVMHNLLLARLFHPTISVPPIEISLCYNIPMGWRYLNAIVMAYESLLPPKTGLSNV